MKQKKANKKTLEEKITNPDTSSVSSPVQTEKVRRGIDFGNRFGENRVASRFRNAFLLRSKKLNRLSYLFISILFVLNIVLIYPIFSRNFSVSFSSSAILLIAGLLKNIGINENLFFTFLVTLSLSFAPISFYLFFRRMSLKHEVIAFLATLFFILPNTLFSQDILPLPLALLHGDGSHVVIFAVIPLFLLYIQAFISNGKPAEVLFSCIGIAIIEIISPFAFFNLLIFMAVITIAEGFMGEFRIKIGRFLFLVVFSVALSFFWYYNFLIEIFVLSYIQSTISRVWAIFPLLIPAIPVFGAIFFLIFDRREKLKPIFISLSLFLIYFFLFTSSNALSINGIFTADRYLIELYFSASFLVSVFFVIFGEVIVRSFVLNIKNKAYLFLIIFLGSGFFTLIMINYFIGIKDIHGIIEKTLLIDNYNVGIGNLKRTQGFNAGSAFAGIISTGTLIFLMMIARKFPSVSFKKKSIEKN